MDRLPDQMERTATRVLDAAFTVHRELGPGLLEQVYETCLTVELKAMGVPFTRQVILPIRYRGEDIKPGLRLDLLVENTVIVEVKSVERLADIHVAQALTYLKLSRRRLCLLINFNSKLLKDGIRRIVI